MLQTLLTIDGHRYELAAEQDLDGLKHQLLEAVTGTARFVDIAVAGQGRATVSVLVTPRVQARLEQRQADVLEVPDGDVDVWPADVVLDDDLDLHDGLCTSLRTGTDG